MLPRSFFCSALSPLAGGRSYLTDLGALLLVAPVDPGEQGARREAAARREDERLGDQLEDPRRVLVDPLLLHCEVRGEAKGRLWKLSA